MTEVAVTGFAPSRFEHRSPPPIRTWDRARYAGGSLVTGLFSSIPTVLLLYFCTDILNIPAGFAALIIIVPKLWTIIWDPLVGSWSDCSASTLGRRRPFLAIGGLGVAIFTVVLFSPPSLSLGWLEWWMLGSNFLFVSAYSLFAVPYIALPAEVAADEPSRARMVSWRMTMAMAGTLIGVGAVPWLVELFGGGRLGYGRVSLILAVIFLASAAGPFAMMRGRESPSTKIKNQSIGPIATLMDAAASRRFIILALSYLAATIGIGALTSTIPYLVTRVLGREPGEIGTALLAIVAPLVIAVPLWSSLARRVGQRVTMMLSLLGLGVCCTLVALLAWFAVAWPLLLGVLALAGVTFAGMQTMMFTAAADAIHQAHVESGSGEASFSGVWTACEKIGLASGPMLTALCLTFAASDVRLGLCLYLGLLPLGLLVASAALYVRAASMKRAPVQSPARINPSEEG